MKEDKRSIFAKGYVPGQNDALVHALALQLVARGIIGLSVPDNTLVGTYCLKSDDIRVSLLTGECADGGKDVCVCN